MAYSMRATALVMIAVCAVAITAAQENADSGAATKILALENAWDRALENKDIRVLDAIFDNGMVYVEYDGTLLTKAELLAKIQTDYSHPQQIVTQPMTVRVFGNAAIVIAYYREKGTERGKPYERRGRFIDTWVFKNGSWTCVAAQTTLLSR
jgi:ketosteroid isomerase-like protein